MKLLVALLLGALLGYYYSQYDVLLPCNNPLESTKAECYYSPNWLAARNLFLHHAKQAGAELVELNIGPGLVIDVAVINATAPNSNPEDIVIHISGTHGVEGFAGSAVQSAFLHQLRTRKVNKTLVFVHGLNPFGMQNFRRANENNVDINRNVLFNGEFASLTNRDPNLAGYEDYTHVFNPQRRSGWESDLQIIFDFVKMAWKQGKEFPHNFKRALVSGTYSNKQGLFYGGNELQPSHVALSRFLVDRGFTKRRNVVFVDVHTGLGPFAKDTLIVSHQFEVVRRVFGGPKGREPYSIEFQGEKGGNEASDGYDLVQTDTQTAYGALFEHQPILSLTQEFGTVPSIAAAYALIKENQAWFHSKDLRRDGEGLKAAFSPHSQSFAERVIKRGLIVLEQTLL